MGQQQIVPYKEYEKQYSMVSQNKNGQMLIKHKHTNKQFLLRKIIVNSQQELEERIKLLNRRRKIKSDHLLNIVDFKPIKDDRLCLGTMYVSLLIEYPFESLYFETLHRISYHQSNQMTASNRLTPLHFQQHELWSILYSCTLGLEALYSSDMVHEGISKSMIFIDKDGVVKIGDPILLGSRTNYDKAIEIIEKQRKREDQPNNSKGQKNNFYDWNETNLRSISKTHRGKSTSRRDNNKNTESKSTNQNKLTQKSDITDSLVISPELISFCKDNQSYYYDKEKSDVYVLGAIMVQLALLDNVFSFNIKSNQINTDFTQIFDQGAKLKEKYSSAFLDIVSDMINIDPRKRPTFTKIGQMIQEFSIQQNSQSDRYSLKKNNQSQQITQNQSQNLLNKYVFNDQTQINYGGINTNLGYGNLNSFKTGNVNASSQFVAYNNLSQQPNTEPKIGFNSHQFPSFSVHKDPSSIPYYEQSEVKQQFSSKFPIKHVQSPLIIPVSNIRGRLETKQTTSHGIQTPFKNLNLTESNENWAKKQNDKESIVKQKITLFGGQNNVTGDQLMVRVNEHKQHFDFTTTTDGQTKQRFSLNKFGRIELTNNNNANNINGLSAYNSPNTSTVPTPRFQNPFNNAQSVPKVSEIINKQMLNFNTQLPSFDNQLNSPFGSGAGNQKNTTAFALFSNGTPTQINNSNSLEKYNKINTVNLQPKTGPTLSTYNPKKQGFSISQQIKEGGVTSSFKKDTDPYYSNSSVGYTLPKYRPQSTSSAVIRSLTQQRSRASSANVPSHKQSNFQNVSKTGNIFKETESLLQRTDSSHNYINLYNQKTNYTDSTPSLSKLMNQKTETYSIYSSQNTARKNNQMSIKNSSKKKYNFYKKEMNQELEKISIPLHQKEEMLLQTSFKQNLLSSIKKSPQSGLKMQESKIIQIQYQPKSHSVYVDEQQPNGCIYRGFKLNNQRHGHGTLIFADSGFYKGQFYQNKMQGEGKLYYNEIDLAYEGQFIHNCFNGHGILYNSNQQKLNGRFDFANMGNIKNFWVKYDGYFKEDQKSGKCHIYFTNGEEFEGFCHNNTFEGKGKFKTLQGDEIEGIWRNNVLIEILNQNKASSINK